MTLRTNIYAHSSTRFEVGDVVSCDWDLTGRITQHRIVAKRTGARGSQTGTLFQVTPPTRRSSPEAWVDAAWFFKDGLEIL